MSTCSKCNGNGKIIVDHCQTCRGEGKLRKTKRVNIDIPPGVDDGVTMHIQGEGHFDNNG